MTQALKPCPFCGGEGHIDGTSWTTRDGKDQAWVTCKSCNTYGPSSTDAVAAWAACCRSTALREALEGGSGLSPDQDRWLKAWHDDALTVEQLVAEGDERREARSGAEGEAA